MVRNGGQKRSGPDDNRRKGGGALRGIRYYLWYTNAEREKTTDSGKER